MSSITYANMLCGAEIVEIKEVRHGFDYRESESGI